jgi:hypothetical protein
VSQSFFIKYSRHLSLQSQALTGSFQPGYSSSIGNAVSIKTACLIASLGVFSFTFPLQRLSISNFSGSNEARTDGFFPLI